ncbi:F-box LRR-repeat 7-like [Solea senegalensis]|uniref:F-box LRR-repeat 7-like n=1 Tax=Solea senegalensis TaxID=28829 RepID=A0AAV6QHC7_SOLSE|nr:uncharacterized protein LOC122769998 isoform X2 [Solea senegalensis]KAG7489526.1 F-box LRR-repeat 7-like [Solea senegalensis]
METDPTTREAHAMSTLLEASGNCRQNISQELNLHPVSDSLCSEQKKLRHVLDWAHRFLCYGSEVYQEFCRADRLILAVDRNEMKRKTEEMSPLQDNLPHMRDEVTWPENREMDQMKQRRELQHPSVNHSIIQDNEIVINGLHKSMSQTSTNQTYAPAKHFITDSKPCWSSVSKRRVSLQCDYTDMSHTMDGAQSKGSENQQREEAEEMMGVVEEKTDTKQENKFNSASMLFCDNNDHDINNDCPSKPQREPAQESQTAQPSFPCHLQIPSNLTVYEKYQLCMDQLQNLRLRQNHVTELGCLFESPTKVQKTCKEVVAPVETPVLPTFPFKLYSSSTNPEFKKRLNEKTHQDVSAAENPEESSSDYLTLRERLIKKHTSEDRRRQTSPQRDTQTFLQPTDTHKRQYADLTPTSPFTGATVHAVNNTDSKDGPAGVPVRDCWLCLPDEVWLLMLSLLPHSDLCRVSQVCSHLHRLTIDHTLWKHLTIENSTLPERWLVSMGRRRPLSLCLYSCSGPSITSNGLEMFFTLCRNYLEEVKVISCTGAGLHGDRILRLIGQLCDHVTTVDVSWSGATDTGVKALSGGCARSRLNSIILNGCHVTDDPLKKLIVRHKESLCRLEVFGCQYLTPSCLQSIYQMCPALKHLNIGQVPKVNAHSLTALTSQLKCLISLNLTALQAVTDDTVATLLQNCVKLQRLNLSSCPGVTDLTLHNIGRYTPCIRSLDLRGCKAVTDAGVQSLTLGCRRLQYLDLSSTSTGNRGVNLLTNYCSGHLHTVKLSFCHISLANILKLCRRGKRLKVLHLYGCARLPTEREIREVNTNVQVYPLP